jgi:3,4-dihydroxy 2-butanone 4-phosphate synthase/3,4-dihydroxy 2-butanone 4-phosphate synthase/GTP cyclohydrolase II
MFTGHIRELGLIEGFDGAQVLVRAPRTATAIQPGGSVCVSGVRLTVQETNGGVIAATVAPETRCRSTFDSINKGVHVNVESPLAAGDPLDGHLVQGYVDGVGKIARVEPEEGCLRIWIRPPERLLPRLVAKAPIAVDGVSVTIAERLRDRFSIVVVPATRTGTTLDQLAPGVRVNLELDLVARLVASRGQAARTDLPRVTAALGQAGRVGGRAAVDQALAQLAAGGGVAVWDPDAEAEGDVVFAGQRIRPGAFRFLLTEVFGHPTVPCAPEVLDRLGIGPTPGAGDRQGTAFHIPVDLASAPGTGVSAAERAATVRRLASQEAEPADFVMPGHVHPLRARPGLLAERCGHTEATVALCVAAGLAPVGVCSEVMNADGTMAGPADLELAALRWGLPLVEIADLKAWL